MSASETMLAAVAGIENMLDLTGAIITNPERVGPRVSTAEVLALALATEGLWALAIENALLLKVLQDTVPMPPPALAKRINARGRDGREDPRRNPIPQAEGSTRCKQQLKPPFRPAQSWSRARRIFPTPRANWCPSRRSSRPTSSKMKP
jgi:hypothetical protein